MANYNRLKNIMNPKLWGPHAWFFLHAVAESYPEKPKVSEQNNIVLFFDSLQFALPCPKCGEHYRKMLEEYPVREHVSSKKSLVAWLVNIHNRVNTRLGKLHEQRFPFEDYVDKKRTFWDKHGMTVAITGLALLCLLTYSYKIRKK